MTNFKDWSLYVGELRRSIEEQLASTDYEVWVGKAASPGGGPNVRIRTDDSDRYPLNELLQQGGQNALLLTAEAGAGKTTLSLRLILRFLDIDPVTPPLLLQLGLWSGLEDLLSLAVAGIERGPLDESLRSGGHLVVFDAVDEIQADDLETPCRTLSEFILKSYPLNTYLITSRTAEVPPWFTRIFRKAEVLPLTPQEVEQHLGPALRMRPKLHATLARKRLIELCRNPLVLSMAQRVFLDEETLEDIHSRSGLYQQFLRSMEAREEQKSGLRDGGLVDGELRAAVLRRLSWEMHSNGVLFADLEDVQEWLGLALRLGDFDGYLYEPAKWTGRQLADAVTGRPPLKRVRARLGHERCAFLHATFRDVYVAQHILRGGVSDFDLSDALLDTSRLLWPVFVHIAGLSPGPTDLIRTIVRLAVEHQRQDLFILAAECLTSRWDSPRSEADELCIRMLDAFKNWDKPFDYHLMRAAEALLPWTSRGFPNRLKNDLRYFLGKYARFVPVILEVTRTATLISLLRDTDETMACNAAHTLLDRYDPDDEESEYWVAELCAAQSAGGPRLREEFAAVLKEIANRDHLTHAVLRPFFLTVVEDAGRSAMERVYALQGLAVCGDAEEFEVFRTILLNHEFPFRDSASWALQIFARRFTQTNPDLVRRALETYSEALSREATDSTGSYAKGNILYSIGALGGTDLQDQVAALVNADEEPYVIEDGVNCLGLLCQPDSWKVTVRALDNSDPAVRMKALEALGRCGSLEARDAIKAQTLDSLNVVQEAATLALQKLQRSGEFDLKSTDGIDWRRVMDVLSAAERRTDQTKIMQSLALDDVALLQSAVSVLRTVHSECPPIDLRGPDGRQDAVMRNLWYHRLEELAEGMAQ